MIRVLMLALVGLSLVACGPGGLGATYTYKVVNPGRGDDVVKKLNRQLGSRWTFGLVEKDELNPLPDAVITRKVQLTNGPEVTVYSTPSEDVFLETKPEGEFVWGGSSDLSSGGILQIKLPLKQDLEWETADEKGTPWYRYRVETIERVDTPAGTFTTARTLQLNLRDSSSVTRWYADEVGLVQRNNSLLLRYQLNREAP